MDVETALLRGGYTKGQARLLGEALAFSMLPLIMALALPLQREGRIFLAATSPLILAAYLLTPILNVRERAARLESWLWLIYTGLASLVNVSVSYAFTRLARVVEDRQVSGWLEHVGLMVGYAGVWDGLRRAAETCPSKAFSRFLERLRSTVSTTSAGITELARAEAEAWMSASKSRLQARYDRVYKALVAYILTSIVFPIILILILVFRAVVSADAIVPSTVGLDVEATTVTVTTLILVSSIPILLLIRASVEKWIHPPRYLELIALAMLFLSLPILKVSIIHYTVVACTPVIMLGLRFEKWASRVNREFPRFLRDLTEHVTRGVPPGRALQLLGKGYSGLDSLIENAKSVLSLGFSFHDVLLNMASKLNGTVASPFLRLTVESLNYGKPSEVLFRLSTFAEEMRNLRESCMQALSGYVMTALMSFAVSLSVGIMLGRLYNLPGMLGPSVKLLLCKINIFQAWTVGLTIGTAKTGSLSLGLKYVLLLSVASHLANLITLGVIP